MRTLGGVRKIPQQHIFNIDKKKKNFLPSIQEILSPPIIFMMQKWNCNVIGTMSMVRTYKVSYKLEYLWHWNPRRIYWLWWNCVNTMGFWSSWKHINSCIYESVYKKVKLQTEDSFWMWAEPCHEVLYQIIKCNSGKT